MGWNEMQAWLNVRAKQLAPPEPDPFSWDSPGNGEFWSEADRIRSEQRGW